MRQAIAVIDPKQLQESAEMGGPSATPKTPLSVEEWRKQQGLTHG